MSEGITGVSGRRLSEEAIDAAFNWLHESSEDIGFARGNLVRKKYEADQIFAQLYLNAAGSIETRKMIATAHRDYAAAMEKVAIAEGVWAKMQDQRGRAETILETFRTLEASQRAIARIR